MLFLNNKNKTLRANQHAVIVCLISNDIFERILPIYNRLVLSFQRVDIVIYNWASDDDGLEAIIAKFYNSSINPFFFQSSNEILFFQKNNKNASYFYLIKHSQINLFNVYLYYFYFRNKSFVKFIEFFYLPYIKNILSHKKNKSKIHILVIKNLIKYLCLNFLGFILIFLLQVYLKTFRGQRKFLKSPPRYPKKILFARIDHLGDMICTLPALYALRRSHPKAHLTVICSPSAIGILEENPHLCNEIIEWDAPWTKRSGGYIFKRLCSVWSLINMTSSLRHRSFDLAIQPRGDELNLIFSILINTKYTVSGINSRHKFFSALEKYIDKPVQYGTLNALHISDWPKLCLAELGIYINKVDVRNSILASKLDSHLNNTINGFRQDGYKVFCIMIGCGNDIRKWPDERYIKLINSLFKQKTISIIIGGERESLLARKIIRFSNAPIIDLVGKLNFSDLSSVIKKVDLVISPDTSVMHLTSLLGKKIIALFGAGNLSFARPVYSESKIIKNEQGCSGCADNCIYIKNSPYAPCMEKINIKDVISFV